MSAASIYEGQDTLIPVVNAFGNVFEEWQIATAAQTVFILASFQYTPGTNTLLVFKNGLFQRPGVDYTETNSTRITFAAPTTINDRIAFFAFATSGVAIPNGGGVPAGGSTAQALVKKSNSDYDTQWFSLTALVSLLDSVRANVVSANTVDLFPLATTTRNIQITGTTTIAGFQIANGQLFAVTFASALTLTNGASLDTKVGSDLAVVAGTTCLTRATADNTVEILAFTPPSQLVTPGRPNLLINSGGVVNQRNYVSAAATGAANQYTLDRWRVVVSGQNLTYVASGLSTLMTAPAGGVEQVVEGNRMAGGVYTLSWTGTATATVNGAAIANRGQTAVLGAAANATIRFSAGTFQNPKFELSPVATPYATMSYADELRDCMRYCQRFNYTASGVPVAAGVFFSSVGAQFTANLLAPMRAAPAMTASSLTFSSITGTGVLNLGTGVLASDNIHSWYATFSATASSTAGFGAVMRTSGSQWIQAESEL